MSCIGASRNRKKPAAHPTCPRGRSTVAVASAMVLRAQSPREPRARWGRAALESRAMHGLLSAAIIVLAYVVVAAAAGYTAVKVIRGGPHGG